MRVLRTETGLRLLLLSMAFAILSVSLPELAGALLANPPVSGSFWVRTLLLPGISSVLIVAGSLSGITGIVIIESNRGRIPTGRPRTWDSPRLAALLAFLSGAVLLVSGIVLGLVYIQEHRILVPIRIAAWAAVALGVGIYLLWTAERFDAARLLGRIALAFGIVSAGLGTAASVALLLGATFADPLGSMILALCVSATGTMSLVAWIVVYAGILGRVRSIGEPSPVPGGA